MVRLLRWPLVLLLTIFFVAAARAAEDDVKGFIDAPFDESPFDDSMVEDEDPPPPLEQEVPLAPNAAHDESLRSSPVAPPGHSLGHSPNQANWIQPPGCGGSQSCCNGCCNGCCNSCCNGCCNGCCCQDCGDAGPMRLLPQSGFFELYGWLDGGYMGNTTNGPGAVFHGPYNAVDRSEGMFNQAYLVAERSVAKSECFDVGGRLDALYGFDFFLAQSLGVELNQDGSNRWNQSQYYGLAMPQAYLEAGNQQASIKVGHFYSIVGFEGVTAPSNFFYSKAYSYQFAGPFTHWGALATYKANDNWQLQGGAHLGWNALDRQQDHVSFIGGLKYTNDCRDFWSSFAVTTGEEPNNPAGLGGIQNQYANRTRYSFIVDKQYCSWEYVFHHWMGIQQAGAPGGGTALWYGIDQYLYYRWNACHRFGVRAEWFRDEQGTRVGLNRPGNPNNPPLPGSYYSLSAGWNWTPNANLVVRPEIRWDIQDGPNRPYDNGRKDYQVMLGLDTIVLF
ncbi:MAG: outer membrane beta-barrel protein [Pirellulales bacterium]